MNNVWLLQAAEGLQSFCKTIMMFRAMLMQHSLAPVLERMLQHIKLEDFLMSGMQSLVLNS